MNNRNSNCEFCKKEFTSISSLNKHKLTAKYCLKLQKVENNGEFNCKHCDKKFTVKKVLLTHLKSCKVLLEKQQEDIANNIKNQLETKDNKIKELEGQINDKNNKIKELEKENIDIIKNLKKEIIYLDIVKPKDKILKLNGIPIISRKEDGYINLTSLCKAGNKEFNEWKRNKKTQAFLEVIISSPRILGNEIIRYNSGSNNERSSWGHPQVAINLAQWISPEFDVQVSKWVYELALTGKVELGNEKTSKQLDNLYEQKRLSLDIQPYMFKDVLYFFEFIPNPEYLNDKSTLENETIHYFEFGVSSNIQQRQGNYGTSYRLDKVFIYNTGYKASLAESYMKKIAADMNLKLNYKNKIECMHCTYEQLENIYDLMIEHNSTSKEEPQKIENNINPTEYSFEVQKLQIQKEAEIAIERIQTQAETEKVTNKRNILMNMIKEGIITFEQFKECFNAC